MSFNGQDACVTKHKIQLNVSQRVLVVLIGMQELLPDCQPSPMTDSGLSSSSTSSSISLGAGGTALSHLSPTFLSEVNATVEQDEKVKALIEFITSR